MALSSIKFALNPHHSVNQGLVNFMKNSSSPLHQNIISYITKREWELNKIPKLLGNYRNFDYLYKDYVQENINVAILALAPYDYAQLKSVCPPATEGCIGSCLGKSYSMTRNIARVKRTILFQHFPNYFYNKLFTEIYNHIVNSLKNNKIPVIRLNGFSDILWENKKYHFALDQKLRNQVLQKQQTFDYSTLSSNKPLNHQHFISRFGKGNLDIVNYKLLMNNQQKKYSLFDYFPNILFYDYTKYSKKRIIDVHNNINNYYLTYSRHENLTVDAANDILNDRININMVASDSMMEHFILNGNIIKNIPHIVQNGNAYDCRFLDLVHFKAGSLIVQKTTKSGIKDQSGFVINNPNTIVWQP